jgi:26S proteasome regulatory subunit (ATPase 3-interacting protein)
METLEQMTAETTRLKDATAALKADEKGLRASLRDHTSLVPLPELKASVAALQQEREVLSARLAKLKDGDVKPITPEEREKVSVEHSKWKKQINSRRKICSELWKIIAGVVVEPDKTAETKEKLGLESF